MGVLQRIIFSHTPDEAMSGGLAKACVPGKNCSVPEKNRVLNIQYIYVNNICQGTPYALKTHGKNICHKI